MLMQMQGHGTQIEAVRWVYRETDNYVWRRGEIFVRVDAGGEVATLELNGGRWYWRLMDRCHD